jgi:uncharacterized protein YkwD
MNKYQLKLFILLVIVISFIKAENASVQSFPTMEQLDAQYKAQWSDPKYATARAADTVSYLSAAEKKIYYYLNMVRIDPKLFAATYAAGYKGANGYRNAADFDANEKSLIKELNALDPLHVLSPNKYFYSYANCQSNAVVARKLQNPHDRVASGCPNPGNYGECAVAFVPLNPLDIVMGWLNDSENVRGPRQLGHRKICLEPKFRSLGVSIANFGQSSETAIADFSFDN